MGSLEELGITDLANEPSDMDSGDNDLGDEADEKDPE